MTKINQVLLHLKTKCLSSSHKLLDIYIIDACVERLAKCSSIRVSLTEHLSITDNVAQN